MSQRDDATDFAKQASSDLLAAYKARLAWLENEKEKTTADLLLEELGRVEGAIGAASHAILDVMQVHTRVLERHRVETGRRMADRDAIVQPLLQNSDKPKTEVEIGFALMQIELVRMMDQTLTFSERLSAFAGLTYALMCKSGQMVLRTTNEAAVSAFFEELHTGLADMVLAKTPLTDLGVIVLRAFEAARDAEDKRRKSADDHLTMLQRLRESCFAWAAAAGEYTLRLEAMLAQTPPSTPAA